MNPASAALRAEIEHAADELISDFADHAEGKTALHPPSLAAAVEALRKASGAIEAYERYVESVGRTLETHLQHTARNTLARNVANVGRLV